MCGSLPSRSELFVLVGLVLALASACGPVMPEEYATPTQPPAPLGPPPQLVASAQNRPSAIVADGTGVYWIDAGVSTSDGYDSASVDGAVMKASLDATGVTEVVTGLDTPTALATDSTTIFFARAGMAIDGADGSLSSVRKDGTDQKVLVASVHRPSLVAVDDRHLFWVERYYADSTLKRASKDGSDVVTLAKVGEATHMTLADGAVFLTDAATGSIERVDENGGAPVVLTTDEGCRSSDGCPSGVTVSDGTVYWGAGSALMQMNEDGDGLSPLFAPRVSSGLVADGDALYWADFAQGRGSAIVRASISSGAVTVLAASDGFAAEKIAVGPTAVYWTSVRSRSDDLVGQGDVWMIGK